LYSLLAFFVTERRCRLVVVPGSSVAAVVASARLILPLQATLVPLSGYSDAAQGYPASTTFLDPSFQMLSIRYRLAATGVVRWWGYAGTKISDLFPLLSRDLSPAPSARAVAAQEPQATPR